ncbi:MAG: Na/Pi cotransporter family protein [Thermoguttaceae bacterium]|nr:Na/Pi cotransporter family protein [Thermoguttaceae bacterium]
MKFYKDNPVRAIGAYAHPKRKFGVPVSLAAVLLAFLAAFAGQGRLQGNQQETEPIKVGAANDISDDVDPEESEIPVNWLPDLRVSKGAPESHVDLEVVSRQLCERRYFHDDAVTPDRIEWEIEQVTNPDVAKILLAGKQVCVQWNGDVVDRTKVVLKASLKDDPSKKAYAVFYAESWAPDYVMLTLIFIGGLGLFLLGMRNMSDGLTAMAGSKIRRFISLFTGNRFSAVGVGVLTTTLVQSSTATSVMTLGFVDSGLMTLKQAIGVIIGANVGTTTTGWLLTVDIGKYGLSILGIAAFFYMFCKRDWLRNFATFALGIGMIFFSLDTLKNGMAPLADLPQFTALLQSFQATSMVNVGKCILVGCVTTFLVHSSAVTLALTMTLALLGSIDLNSAIAIVLGSNIGTTLTALFVAFGSNANAQRVAWFHLLFNLFGVMWVWASFFVFLIPCVNFVGNLCGLESDVTKIALTHTIFNVANMIVFLPLTRQMDAFLRFIVPDKPEKPRPSTTGLATFATNEPIIGVERSRLEIQRMFGDCRELAEKLATALNGKLDDSELVESAFRLEDKLDHVQDETIDFISKLTTKTFSVDLASSAREQIRLAEELETISDYLVGVLKSNLKLKNAQLELPKMITDKTPGFLQNVDRILEWLEQNFSRRRHERLAGPMAEWRRQYVDEIKETRDSFMQHMFEEENDPLVIVAVEYQLNAWRRMYEHLLNIAEAMEVPAQGAKSRAAK